MSRRKVTLRLSNDIVERAKDAGMNLSYFLEVKLVEHLALISNINFTPRRRFELLRGNTSRDFQSRNESMFLVTKSQVDEYLSLREIEGLNNGWVKSIRRFILDYVNVVNWRVSKESTFEYLKTIQKNFSVSYYRKRACQIRRFLLFLNCDWAEYIRLPKIPPLQVKRVTKEDVSKTLELFKNKKSGERYVALTLLGASSGMRPKEMYQLQPENIDLDNMVVYVNHNPDNGQTTKTKRHRIALFDENTKQVLEVYLDIYANSSKLKKLFSKRQCERVFEKCPLHVKDLRKFFSQEWDRSGGPTSIKKILMGHSLNGDVDLRHYNHQSEEDLKRIYDSVMTKSEISSF